MMDADHGDHEGPMPTRPDHGAVRGVRAAVLTAPAVGAGVLGHVLADGCADLLGTLLAVGVVWPAAVAVLGRRRSPAAFLAWVVGAQAVTHLLLELTCSSVRTGQMSLVQHLVATSSGEMVTAHAVAAVLTAVALGRADAGLWAAHALRRAVRRLRVPTPILVVPVLPRTAAPVVLTELRDQQHHQLPGRRGPPARLGV